MRQVFSTLTAMGVLAAMALACGGPQEEKDVAPGDATVEVDAGEVVECPAGLVPWPGGGCAPRVDECANPWELPLIGGGCVAIGPRACPKLWDPEADVDCEPGKLMEYDGNACPEGFVLTEDEVACVPKFDEDCGENQIPLLGGGCRDVGPAVEPPEPPVFDHCASGELALFGGGCVQVGPRACPKLWDPEADMDCEVGDVLPCPDGCIESEDGTYCEPVRDDCGEGERPLLGGGCKRVIPLAADCPAGPFPEAPAGATGTVYVSAGSACTEGCGSAGAPYSSLQAAVEAVPTGGAVLVGPGAYGEGVVVAKSLAIVGLCAAKVELASVVEGQPGACIAVQGPFEVKLSGVRLAGPGFGLFAAKGSILELDQVEVMQAQGAAVYVGDATVKGSGLWLHDLLPHAVSGLQGHGVVASDGASVVLEESIIDNARAAGVAASGSKTQVELTEVLIRDTQLDDEGKQGHGVLADGGAEVTLDRVVADANRHTQVLCTGADTKLEVKESLIRNGQPDADGNRGRGLAAWDGCEATIESSVLRDNLDAAILASGAGVIVTAKGAVVTGTEPAPSGKLGYSAFAQAGARLIVEGCYLGHSTGGGAALLNSGTEVALSGTVLLKVQSQPNGQFGRCMELAEGGKLSMELCVVEDCRDVGILGIDAETMVDLDEVTVRSILPDPAGGSFGMAMQAGSALALRHCLVEGVGEVALALSSLATEAEVLESSFRNIAPPEGADSVGSGISVQSGASLTMASSIMEDIVGVGGQVWDSGTTVLLEETVIRDISPWKNDAGTGLQVADGARLEVRKSLVDQASQTGILALGVGTEVMVEDTVVQETLPAGPNKLGLGIQVQPGATAEVLRCEFKECSVSSVSVLGQGATASLSDCIIRDTAAKEPDAGTGRGIELQQEASLVADAVLVESNRFEGIGVADGSTADLSAMVVRSTIGGGPQQVGRGLSVFGGGQATVTESVIAGNRDSGVFVMGAGSAVSLGGVLVADTLPNEVNGGGAGLIMSEGATLDVSDSWIRGNSGGGVSTQDSKTVLLMERTVVEDSLATWESELGPEVFGRGIDASYGAWASVSGCLVQGNTEVGVYASGSGGTMDLAGSIVRDTLCHEAGLAGGGHGMGVVAMGGANTQVRYALIQHNDTAGAACHGQVTELGLGHVAILDTQGGMSWYDDVAGTEQKQAFGDGAYAAEGCRMVVAASLLASNRRTGLYFLQSPGQVVGNLIHSNDFYGLAMEECADQVEWEGKGNYIVGNASALPPDKAAQVTTSTGGMAVPPAPEMIEIPSGTGE